MGVPKRRRTISARNQRRSHAAKSAVSLAKCKNCGQPVMPHVACKNCGYYRGRKVTK